MSLSVDLGRGQPIQIRIRASAKARRISLVSGIEGVQAIVPRNYSAIELSQFAKSKRDWLLKTSMYYSRLKEKCGGYEPGTILFRGSRYRSTAVNDRQFSVTVSNALGVITFHVPDKRKLRKYQQDWYRQQTSAMIAEQLPALAAKMGMKYNNVSIKKLKSRWGSCSKKGNLNFNLMLASAPEPVVRYVIIHELAHLAVLNHSARFWAIVNDVDPDHRSHREWLSTYAPLIEIG